MFRDQEAVSPEMQLAAAREYAARFGDADLVVLTDMNISGRKGRRKRPGFDALLSAIEADRVSAVYSYSLSRLSRQVRDIMELAELCHQRNVPIRLARDNDPDPTTASGRMMLGMLGVVAQFEADVASERALDAVAARRARGDQMGTPVFANHEAVIEAFRAAGSCTGAAKLLTTAGVRTRNGNELWYPSAVRVIIARTAPELLPKGQPRGTKAAAPFVFYRLLRCHCDTILTGWRRPWGYVSYRCTRGRLRPGHGKTHVPETLILSWARREAARLRPPTEAVALAESTEREQAALRDRLARLRVAFLAGLVEEAEMRSEKHEIDEALTRLDLAGRAMSVPGVVWWPEEPAALNRTLRAIWSHVQLDRDLRPVLAEWLLPPDWLAPPVP